MRTIIVEKARKCVTLQTDMAKKNEIIVKDVTIRTMNVNGVDYICISDIARQKNVIDPNGVIGNWMRNRNTIEYLGLWETLHNPNFNPLEFEGFRKEAGLNQLVKTEITSPIFISQAPHGPTIFSKMPPVDGLGIAASSSCDI